VGCNRRRRSIPGGAKPRSGKVSRLWALIASGPFLIFRAISLRGRARPARLPVLIIPVYMGTSGDVSIQSFKPGTVRFAFLGATFAAAAAVISLLLALVWRTEFGWVLFALFLVSAVCSLIVAIGAYHRAHSDRASSRESAGA
jgi:hypothetical protein